MLTQIPSTTPWTVPILAAFSPKAGMLFPTITFAIFFVIVLPASWVLMRRRAYWKIFILVASYFFYAFKSDWKLSWTPWENLDWPLIVLLATSTVGNQFFAVLIDKSPTMRWRRTALTAAVTANLGALAYFKYYGFFVSSVANGLAKIGIETSPRVPEIVLPIAISFFTFQALSYVIDIYRGEMRPVKLANFAVYLSFFPHLIAGPIVRASEFLPQMRQRSDPRRIDGSRAFALIVGGLFKKMVLANFLGTQIVDGVFESPKQHSALEILIAIYGYAVQIYCDFSGYTDIAIGLALLLGFRFPANFNAPYTARNLQDFWRRWHMTLSRWLRDYLFIPLGGSQGSRRRTYRNLMLTMLIGGLWHGAAWTFVAWGAIHGGGLALERFMRDRRIDAGLPATRPERWWSAGAQRIATFHIVCLAWVFFRAETFGGAWTLISRLATGWGEAPLVKPAVLLAITVGIGMQYVPAKTLNRIQVRFSNLAPVAQGVILGLSLLLIDALGPQGVSPFIYFRF